MQNGWIDIEIQWQVLSVQFLPSFLNSTLINPLITRKVPIDLIFLPSHKFYLRKLTNTFKNMENLSADKLNQYLGQLMDWAVVFVPKLILAIFVIIIGLWIVKRISRMIRATIERANVSTEVSSFLGSIIDIVLKLAVFLLAASVLGFEVSSLLALVAAVGFAVGMALQGFLGNFASGITIVFLKPYKVGDWVEVDDKFGKVEAVEIFNTTITTPNEKTLIIPNGKVTEDTITNFSTKGRIRLELTVTMPYEEEYNKVEKIIRDALLTVPNILPHPEPLVGIESYDSHNIVVAVRPYINPDDYWQVTYDAYAAIKKAYSQYGIKVAYSEGVELGPIGA